MRLAYNDTNNALNEWVILLRRLLPATSDNSSDYELDAGLNAFLYSLLPHKALQPCLPPTALLSGSKRIQKQPGKESGWHNITFQAAYGIYGDSCVDIYSTAHVWHSYNYNSYLKEGSET